VECPILVHVMAALPDLTPLEEMAVSADSMGMGLSGPAMARTDRVAAQDQGVLTVQREAVEPQGWRDAKTST